LIRRCQDKALSEADENQGVYSALDDCFLNESNAVFGVFLQRLSTNKQKQKVADITDLIFY
jgi:hypothetical protein